MGPPRSSDLILHPGVQARGWRDHVSVLSISFWLLGAIRVELGEGGGSGMAWLLSATSRHWTAFEQSTKVEQGLGAAGVQRGRECWDPWAQVSPG